MEVCQKGIDELGLPPWCVGEEMDTIFWIQGFLELVILLLFGILMHRFFKSVKKWRKRNKPPPSIWNRPKNPF